MLIDTLTGVLIVLMAIRWLSRRERRERPLTDEELRALYPDADDPRAVHEWRLRQGKHRAEMLRFARLAPWEVPTPRAPWDTGVQPQRRIQQ